MAGKATKVLYDISDAIKELAKLDKKVEESGDKAKKSFGGDATDGLEGLKRQIKETRESVAKLRGSLTKVSGGVSTAAVAFGAAAAAVVGATIAVLDFNNATRDADLVLDDWINSGRELLDIFQAIQQGRNARKDFEFLDRKAAIDETGIAIRQLQVLNDAKVRAASEDVSREKGRLGSLESALKASHRKTLDAEKRLNEKRAELAGDSNEFGNQAKGRRVVSLASKASQLAKGGKVDEAEALIEKAKELSSELGDHVFFTSKIDSANQQVVKALEKNVKTSKKEESALEKQVGAQKGILEGAKARLAEETQIKNQLRDQLKLMAAQKKLISAEQGATQDLQKTKSGQAQVTTAKAAFKNAVSSQANQSPGKVFANLAFNEFRRLSLKSGFGSFEDSRQANSLQDRVLASGIKADKATTPAEIEAAGEERLKQVEELRKLQTAVKDGSSNSVITKTLTRIESLLQPGKDLTAAVSNLEGVGANESIQGAITRQQGDVDTAAKASQAGGQTLIFNNTITGGDLTSEALKKLEAQQRRIARQELAAAAK